jgi:hypothetical protein
MIRPSNFGDIYVDYDGVLVNLLRGFRDFLGRPWEDSYWQIAKKDKKKMVSEYPHFWSTLPTTGDYNILWDFVKGFSPHILTACAEWDEKNSKEGKWEWNVKHTQVPLESFHCVPRENKQLYAMGENGKPNILIDDYKKNIQEWTAAGGIGIMHTSAINTIARLKNLGFYP